MQTDVSADRCHVVVLTESPEFFDPQRLEQAAAAQLAAEITGFEDGSCVFPVPHTEVSPPPATLLRRTRSASNCTSAVISELSEVDLDTQLQASEELAEAIAQRDLRCQSRGCQSSGAEASVVTAGSAAFRPFTDIGEESAEELAEAIAQRHIRSLESVDAKPGCSTAGFLGISGANASRMDVLSQDATNFLPPLPSVEELAEMMLVGRPIASDDDVDVALPPMPIWTSGPESPSSSGRVVPGHSIPGVEFSGSSSTCSANDDLGGVLASATAPQAVDPCASLGATLEASFSATGPLLGGMLGERDAAAAIDQRPAQASRCTENTPPTTADSGPGTGALQFYSAPQTPSWTTSRAQTALGGAVPEASRQFSPG